MNLHRFKRTIGKTNPEKGLRSLPGAQKRDHRDKLPSTVRVKGRYISQDHSTLGSFFGVMGYIHAWIFALGMTLSLFASSMKDLNPITIFFLGFAVVHGCAFLTDGLSNSNSPWAGKSIKIFWIGTAICAAISIICYNLGWL